MVRRNRGDAKARVRSKIGPRRRLGASAAAVTLMGGLGTASLALATPVGATASSNVACGNVYGTNGLVAAINAANANGGGTINLAVGCTYQLTTVDNTFEGPNGLPVITSRVTMNGFNTTIEQREVAAFRILDVDNAGKVILNGLIIAGGHSSGTGAGGILNHGVLTVNSGRITGNDGGGNGGGGIANGPGRRDGPAVLTLNHTRVDNNSAVGGGSGAGIANGGTATLNGSQVDDNTIGASNGGGIFNMGTLTLNGSPVSKNAATQLGGGIANIGTATLNGSPVLNNTAGVAGGGIANEGTVRLSGSLVSGNNPDNCAPPGSVPGCRG